VAATRELARDAADLVEVEYEPLDVVVDARRAQDDGAAILHDDAGTNVVWSGTFDWGDVDGALKAADRVVKIKELHFDRFSSTPLECSAALVEHDRGTGQFTIHCNHQMPASRRSGWARRCASRSTSSVSSPRTSAAGSGTRSRPTCS
jgi:2-furoyl-CoA dehydrogenase large subunit